MPDMKALVYRPGRPEVLKIERRPIPKPDAGQVLIRIMAFVLNRSELFTRQGYSPGDTFARVPCIEGAGAVEEAPQTNFAKGDIVATVMGGMGRMFDGSYAEYTCVPAGQVQKSRHVYRGKRWAQFQRCCKPPGDLCSMH
jgi:NADPH:quinone reductase-like Zn-dependent oxidoreductase